MVSHVCSCLGAPYKTPQDEAAGLIVLLGWDPWDFLDAIEVESDATLHAVLDILRPPELPEEPDRIKMLTKLGTRVRSSRVDWPTTDVPTLRLETRMIARKQLTPVRPRTSNEPEK